MRNATITNLQFEVITDLNQARSVWEQLSPGQEIDDDWEFRHIFYRYLGFPLRFIVAYEDHEAVGLLPLQLNDGQGPIPEPYSFKENFLEFFGGDDTDSNRVLVKDGYDFVIPELLKRTEGPTVLAPLAESYRVGNQAAEIYTHKFVADLSGMEYFRDFLTSNFDGKSRGKLNNKLNRMLRMPGLVVGEADAADVELLYSFNKQRFGTNSSFQWDFRRQIFKDLLDTYKYDVFKVVINGEIKAVSLALLYRQTYLSMNIGYDFAVRDLGKLVASTQLERAIKLGCKVFDSGKGDSGWKEQFHLERVPQYMLTLP